MSQRQLAAIMFTDIVGYTALMGKDSAKALEGDSETIGGETQWKVANCFKLEYK